MSERIRITDTTQCSHPQAHVASQHVGKTSVSYLPSESTNKATDSFVLFQQFIHQAFCSLDRDMGQLTQHGFGPRKALNLCPPSFRLLGFVPIFRICSSMKQGFRIEQQSCLFDSNLSKSLILDHQLFYLLLNIRLFRLLSLIFLPLQQYSKTCSLLFQEAGICPAPIML